jgi:hypothetical protein
MSISFTNAGSRITANAAAVATAMGGGTSTAEAQALGALLTAMSNRFPVMMEAIKCDATTVGNQILPQ